MWSIVNKELMSFEWNFELPGLKEILRARTGENCQSLCGGSEVVFEKPFDAHKVLIKAFPFPRVRRISTRAAGELFANERTKIMFAMLVNPAIEIETYYWEFA